MEGAEDERGSRLDVGEREKAQKIELKVNDFACERVVPLTTNCCDSVKW